MTDELMVRVVALADNSSSAITEFNQSLSKLENKIGKINVKIETNANDLQKQLIELYKSDKFKNVEIGIIADANKFQENIENITKTEIKPIKVPITINADNLKKMLEDQAKLTDFKLESVAIISKGDDLEKFTASVKYYKEGTQEAVVETYKLNESMTALERTSVVASDNYKKYNAELEKHEKALERTSDANYKSLKTLEDSLKKVAVLFTDPNLSKPIQDPKNIEVLKESYSNIETEINRLLNSLNNVSAQEKININSQIKDLERLANSYRNAEYVATKLRAKPIEALKQEEINKLGAFVLEIKTAGAYTDDMAKKTSDLRSQLDSAFTSEEIREYLDQLGIVNSEFKKLKAEAKFEAKFGISTEEFTKADKVIQSIKSSFDSLKSPIGEVKFTIDDLFSSLERIKSMPAGEEQRKEFEQLKIGIQQYDEAIKTATAQDKLNAKIERENIALQKQDSVITGLKQSFDTYLQAHKQIMSDPSLSQKAQIIIETKIDDKDQVAVQKLRDSIRDFKKEAKDAGYETETFGQKLQSVASKYGIFLTLGMVIRQAFATMRDMIDTVIELDDAMTELYKVTDLTNQQYTKFFESAKQSSKEIGGTITDFVSATADFARLGYSIGESEELAKAALVYKNVGDGINDVNEASKSVISTIAAFGIAASDAMGIVDRFNKVGNEFSISSQGVGEALVRSASSLAATNNTLEESIGLIVAANKVVQDPTIVGTAIRTLSMRLTNTAGQLEELGEDAEGAAESITKLQTQILNLTKGTVDIMETNDTFKSTYQIILELSQVWGDLDNVTQQTITRLVAGQRQGNIFNSMMMNMQDGIDATNAALNAQGSALEENRTYMESISGRIDLFNNAFQSLSATIVDSDMVKFFVNLGTVGLQAFEFIIESGTGVPIILLSILLNLKKLETAFITAKTMTLAFGTALKGLTVAHPILLALTVALTAVTVGIGLYNKSQEEAIQKTKELSEKYTTTANSVKEYSKALDELYEKRKQDGNTVEINKQIADLQDQIRLTIGKQAEALDLVNGKQDEQLTKLNEIYLTNVKNNVELLKSAKILAEAKLEEGVGGFGIFGADITGQIPSQLREVISPDEFGWKAWNAPIEFLEKLSTTDAERVLQRLLQLLNDGQISGKDYAKAIGFVSDQLGKIQNNELAVTKATDDLNKAIATVDIYEKFGLAAVNSQDAFNTLVESIKQSTGYTKEQSDEMLRIANDVFPNYAQKLREVSEEQSRLTGISQAEWYKENMIIETQEDFDLLVDSIRKTSEDSVRLGYELEHLNELFPEFSEKAKAQAEALEELTNKISILSQAEKESNTERGIMSETFAKIKAEGEDWADLIEVQNGKLVITKKSLNDFTKSLLDNALQSAITSDATEEQIQSINNLYSIIYTINDAYNDLNKQIDETQSAYDTIVNAQKEYNDTQMLSFDTIQNLLSLGDEYLQYLVDAEGNINFNTKALSENSESLKQQMIAATQAGLATEIMGIIQEDAGNKTDNMGDSADAAKIKLANVGEEAINTAREFGVLAGAAVVANKAMAGEDIDVEGISENAQKSIDTAIKNAEARISLISKIGSGLASETAKASKGSAKSSTDAIKEAFDEQKKLLDLDLKEKTISQEAYYNKLLELNDEYYKNSEKHATEYRNNQIEALDGLAKIEETRLQNLLEFAKQRGDYDEQIRLQEQMQENLHEQAEKYRQREYEATDIEIQELQKKWRGYADNISDTFKTIYESSTKDFEFDIFNLEQTKGNEKEIISIYKRMQQLNLEEQQRAQNESLIGNKDYLMQLQNDYISYNDNIIEQTKNTFSESTKEIQKQLDYTQFKFGFIDEKEYADKAENLNKQIELRLELSKVLLSNLTQLQLETDNNILSSEKYKDLLNDTNKQYQDNIKSIYDLVNAQKDLARDQISSIETMQNDIVKILETRYKKEKDLMQELNNSKKEALEKEKELLKENYDSSVKAIDDQLKAWQKLWDEEDKRKQKEETEADISELQKKINELIIAAQTGDVEAISRIEDINKQIAEKQKKLAEDEAKSERDIIKESLQLQKDSFKEEYDLQVKALDDRIKLLDEELKAFNDNIDEKLKRSNLIAEAGTELAKGLTDSMVNELHRYEDEFGEGMGILGTYVHDELNSQIEEFRIALDNMITDLALLQNSDSPFKNIDTNLLNMSKEQANIIEQMKANSEAWAKATTEAEKAKLAAENEKLGELLGLTKDIASGAWYLDESKTQLAYENINKIKKLQIDNIDEIITKNGEEETSFKDSQDNKLIKLGEYKTETEKKSGELYTFVYNKLKSYEEDFIISINTMDRYLISLITRIESAIDMLNNLIQQSETLKKVDLSMTLHHQSETGNWSEVQRFKTGGRVVGDGLAYVEDKERVLSAKQTEAFEKLVNLSENLFNNNILSKINDLLVQPNQILPTTNNTGNYNFIQQFNGITSEVMPQVKQMFKEFENKIPSLVANSRFRGANNQGFALQR